MPLKKTPNSVEYSSTLSLEQHVARVSKTVPITTSCMPNRYERLDVANDNGTKSRANLPYLVGCVGEFGHMSWNMAVL